MDIFLSHDWPCGITDYGNVNTLYNRERKQFLREDIESGQLGSPPAMEVLHKIKPKFWFSAHLHCKFAACVKHVVSTDLFFLVNKHLFEICYFMKSVKFLHTSNVEMFLEEMFLWC